MSREWVDTPNFLSHLLQKSFNAGLVLFDASNLNIKQFWLCCIITTFHPVIMCNKIFKPIMCWVDERSCCKDVTRVERNFHR